MTHEYPSDAAIDASQFRTWQTFVDTTEAAHVSLRGYLIAKRVLDLAVTLPILVLISPLLALVALSIKLWDHGPVFFTQTRVGKDGAEFTCYKFRSMVPHAERLKEELQALNHHADPRTFKIPAIPGSPGSAGSSARRASTNCPSSGTLWWAICRSLVRARRSPPR